MNPEMIKGKPLTKEETKALLELVEGSKTILSKTTNATNNKMKKEEWLRIADQFNASATSCRRTPAQLRLKWENLKKLARKRSTQIRMNQLKTGGGAPSYIPPDEILDRVGSLLGSTVSGFDVPFGGDRYPEGLMGGEDDSGDGTLGGSAVVYVERMEFKDPLIPSPDLHVASLPSSEVIMDLNVDPIRTPDKPKRVTFNTPRSGKKKIHDGAKTRKDYAIAEYYLLKKKCLETKIDNMFLENERLKLENAKLKLEIEKLKQ